MQEFNCLEILKKCKYEPSKQVSFFHGSLVYISLPIQDGCSVIMNKGAFHNFRVWSEKDCLGEKLTS
jgi:hypothetical protein